MNAERWTQCIKLTDASGQTHGGTQWGRRVANPCGVRSGSGGLCSGAFYHAYDLSPVVPHFLNPQHANFTSPQTWLAEWRGKRVNDSAMKFGATELRTVRLLKVPTPSDLQRRAFAIFVADQALKLVKLDIPEWRAWADTWTHEPTNAAYAAETTRTIFENAAAWAMSREWTPGEFA